MTGHAFQELVEDDEIRAALAAIRSALTDGGRFVFETRNPLVRAWEHWATEYTAEVADASGRHCAVRVPGGDAGGGRVSSIAPARSPAPVGTVRW